MRQIRRTAKKAAAQAVRGAAAAAQAAAQAERFDHTLQREVGYLTVHSMLHLLGYDHVGGGLPAVRMREREEAVMKQVGLPRGESYVME